MPVSIFKLINTLDIGNRGGGAEAFAVNLATSLQKAGENLTIGVLCRTNSKNEIKWVQALKNAVSSTFFSIPGLAAIYCTR